MEDISNTSLLADYFARRRGALLVDVPHPEELDRVDLFSRAMRTSAARGQVDQIIEQALEMMALLKGTRPKKSWCITAAIWQLGKKRLPQLSRYFHAKEVTPASCSSGVVACRYQWRLLTHEQFINTVPQVATCSAASSRWSRTGAVRVWGKSTGRVRTCLLPVCSVGGRGL